MNTQHAGRIALTLALGSLGGCASIVGADFDDFHAKGSGGAVGATTGGGHGGTMATGGHGGTTAAGGHSGTTAAGGHGGTTAAGGHGGAGAGGYGGGHGGTGLGGHGGDTGQGGQGGQGGAACVPACSDPVEPDCEQIHCDNGTCISAYQPVGTKLPVAKQTPGDCKVEVCSGLSYVVEQNDDQDVPVDGNDCRDHLCAGGVPTTPPLGANTKCGLNKAFVCDGQGSCVGCLDNSDCTLPATCGGGSPGTPNVCGCTKKTCAQVGQTCGTPADGCEIGGTLACNDGVKNGSETNVDCGGDGATCALPCGDGKVCFTGTDCASGYCVEGMCCDAACGGGCQACTGALTGGANGVCAPVKAGTDPKGSCGGADACAAGATCLCLDGLKDGAETDIDCGGGTCGKCAVAKVCAAASDCASGLCQVGKCGKPTCPNIQKDGAETDVDCGGGACPVCANGKHCGVNGDCASGACTGSVCAAGGCAVELAAGDSHSCARKGNGTLWCWGLNMVGQLGDGTVVTPKRSPEQVTALGSSVIEVTAGWNHTCARKSGATLWCWGDNSKGQVGDGTVVSPRSSPVQVTALGTNVIEVAAGSRHTCARKADWTLWCWGDNQYGQLGDGTLVGKSSPVQVTALGTGVVEVAAGFAHTCARKVDGTLWCWGYNDDGQVGDGTVATPKPSPVQVTGLGTSVLEVAAGAKHTCARKADGTLWCWGSNLSGELGDGTVVGKSSPVQVTALGTSVVEVAAGHSHVCARKGDGTLWCWGYNQQGQLGDGTVTSHKASPVLVGAVGMKLTEVAAGAKHTCARGADGTVWCWGDTSNGQIGDGTGWPSNPDPRQALLPCP